MARLIIIAENKEKGERKMKLVKLTATSIIALLLLGIAAVLPIPVHAGSGPGFYLSPSTITGTANNTQFTVTAYITNISAANPVFAWQIYMLYNKTQLKIINAKYTGVGNAHSVFFANFPNASSPGASYGSAGGYGYVLIGESLLGTNNETGGGASKSLFTATFLIILPPPKLGSLSSVLDLSTNYPGKTWAKNTSLQVITMTNLGNANYSFTWVKPSPPQLDFTPTSTLYDQYTHAVGKSFTVNVTLNNLSPLWYMLNASFTVNYRDAETYSHLIVMTGYKFNPAWGHVAIDNTTNPGLVAINVSNYTPAPPSGSVLIVNLNFMVLYQGTFPAVDSCKIDNSSNIVLWADPAVIQGVTVVPATVTVKGFLSLTLPYLQIGNVTVGPSPVVGQTFDVPVYVRNLDYHWWVIAIQFKVFGYDATWIQPTEFIEGPFLYYYANLQPGSVDGKTFKISFINPTDIIAGVMILPNGTGWWNSPFPSTPCPNGDIVGWVRFEVMQECYPNNHTEPLLLGPVDTKNFIGLDSNITQNIVKVFNAPLVNGTFTITTNWPGRSIDLVGGAVNDGYGVLPKVWPFALPAPVYYTLGSPYYWAFPTPYGGQGPMYFDPTSQKWNGWMDIVFPQSLVYLNAYVTYNYWPVQSKDVGFEIEGPYAHVANTGNWSIDYVPKQTYQVWAKFSAVTDANGVASINYRMPWPCNDPDSITGVWKITATVTIGDTVVIDRTMFYYERLVYITEVSTDMYQYDHGACVGIYVEYQTHAVEYYPALFAVVVVDNLTVPIGWDKWTTTIGGATFCTWTEGNFTMNIPIPKWAYTGIGYVKVSVYDKDPTIGGEPWCPQFPNGPYVEPMSDPDEVLPDGWTGPENTVWNQYGTQIDIQPY
jgi:hypothetical protein